jgi:hypothetical protein
MSPRPPNDLLYDTEATLRLVDSAIEDIRELDPRGPDYHSGPAKWAASREPASGSALGARGLSEMVDRGYHEAMGVLDKVRESRSALARMAGDPTTSGDGTLRESAALAELEIRLVALVTRLELAARALDRPAE